MFFDMFLSHGVDYDAKNRIKKYYFYLAHNTITILYTRANFKLRYLKTTLGTFFEKTIHGRGPKLGSYVPLKWPKLAKRTRTFFPIIIKKNILSKIPDFYLLKLIRGPSSL